MLPKFIILACLLALATANRLHIGQSVPLLGNRIVGGSSAEKGEFPHQVSLQWGVPLIAPLTHICGGTIINERWILTAAHCVNAVPSYGTLVVKAGKLMIKATENTEQVVTVTDTFVHEKYQGNVAPYDIALLKLKTPLQFNQYVTPISLPKANYIPSGIKAILSGWGSVSTNNIAIMPNYLQKISLTVIDIETCKMSIKKLSGSAPVYKTNICTGPLNGGLSACNGDSGGPLIARNINGKPEIVGVVSWGITPCGSVGAPSVYTRVSAFIDWIDSVINANKH